MDLMVKAVSNSTAAALGGAGVSGGRERGGGDGVGGGGARNVKSRSTADDVSCLQL